MSEDFLAPAEAVIAAERAVLGIIIGSRHAAEESGDALVPDDFWLPRHQLIFEAVQALAEGDGPVEPAAVMAALTQRRQVAQAGGGVFLAELGEMRVLAQSLGWYLREVLKDSGRRKMGRLSIQLAQMASSPNYDPDLDPDTARKLLEDALAARGESRALTSGDVFVNALRRLEEPEDKSGAISPPWDDLRDLIPVFRPGQLITVGARPGAGKSVIASDVLRHVGLKLRLPSILFSMEMSEAEVTDRMLSAESSVSLSRIQARELDDHDWNRIARLGDKFAEGAFVLDDTPNISLAHIRSRLRGMARRDAARIAIVDYLQLVKSPGSAESREREVAALASGLKNLAREFAIPVLLLAQLNRGPEARHDKKPTKADLRESGAIENDSDVVILIHRPDMGDPECARTGEADLIVDKNRAGPTGTRTVLFQGHYGRFAGLAWSPTSSLGDDRRSA